MRNLPSSLSVGLFRGSSWCLKPSRQGVASCNSSKGRFSIILSHRYFSKTSHFSGGDSKFLVSKQGEPEAQRRRCQGYALATHKLKEKLSRTESTKGCSVVHNVGRQQCFIASYCLDFSSWAKYGDLGKADLTLDARSFTGNPSFGPECHSKIQIHRIGSQGRTISVPMFSQTFPRALRRTPCP